MKKVWDNLSMNKKQWCSHFIMILAYFSITFVGFYNVQNLKEQMYEIGKNQVPKTELIGDLKEDITRVRLYTIKQAYEQKAEDKAKMEDIVRQDITAIRKEIKEIEKYDNSAENKNF